MIYIGIDPGFNGGIAVIDDEGAVLALDETPTTNAPRREYLEGAMCDLVGTVQALHGAQPWQATAAIERAQAMPKQGVSSMFSIGLGFGMWRGILAANGIRYAMPRPQDWRKVVGLPNGADKGASVALAARLFPTHAKELRGPRGGLRDGLAEALLIAEYARASVKGLAS